MNSPLDLQLFVVRNHKGEFFRAKGYSGTGNSFVDDINKARIYGRIGPARTIVTYFGNNHSNYPILEILKLSVSNFEVLDEKARVEKAKAKKLSEKANQEKRRAQMMMEDAKKKLAEAEKEVERLKKNQK